MENQLTLANRNNNPGNIKDPSTGNFKVFNSPQEGYGELLNDLETKKSGKSQTGLKPESTLVEFAKVYAPSSDQNNPAQYAVNLANHMGVRPDARISDLDTGKWAEAIANAEGYKNNSNKTEKNSNKVQNFGDYAKNQKQSDSNAPAVEQHGTGLAGVGGSLVAGLLKPFAKVGTSLVNTVQDIRNKPETQPFSGNFLGDVKKVGAGIDVGGNPFSKENRKAIGDSLKTGAEIGVDIASGVGAKNLVKGLLGKSKGVLENPEIVKIMKQGVQSRQGAIDRLGVVLKNMSVKEVGGKKEQLILKALQKLNPTVIEKQSLFKRLAKGGFNMAKNIALTKLLGDRIGGFIHKNTQ